MWWLFFLYLTVIALIMFFQTYNTPNYAGTIDYDKIPMSNIFGWIWIFGGTCFIAALLTEATERIYDRLSKRKIIKS